MREGQRATGRQRSKEREAERERERDWKRGRAGSWEEKECYLQQTPTKTLLSPAGHWSDEPLCNLCTLTNKPREKTLLTPLPFTSSSSRLLHHAPPLPLGAGSRARESGSQCAKHFILPNRRFNRNSCEDAKSYVCNHSARNTFFWARFLAAFGSVESWLYPKPIFVNCVTFPPLLKQRAVVKKKKRLTLQERLHEFKESH